jgi:hypothetical protein
MIMKKILVGSGIIMMTTGLFAQEAADKKVQAGIVLGSGLAMQKMGTNYIQTNGVGTDLTIGANVNFSLTETIAFSTGLEFDFESLKYKAAGYNGNNLYYWYNDKEIITLEDQSEDPSNTNHNLFEMQERSHKAMYLTIPTMMVFRTNFIGYMRYFGKFGLRNSFLLSNTITDTGFNLDPNVPIGAKTAATNEDMKAPGEMFFFKSAVGLAAGAEWNFSGSTSLVAEIGYYYGFTPLHTNRNTDKNRNYTFATPGDADASNDLNINNKATQSQLQLKVSILF